MRFALFYHSLISDWNHGNAHFLRGVVSELIARGHDVRVFEPQDAWSVANLLSDAGPGAIEAFGRAFPALHSERYVRAAFDLSSALDGADVVIAHEWNEPELLRQLAAHRAKGGRYRLLFHDTHHRAVSDPDALARVPLEGFDGVLAFGESLREQYVRLGWGRDVWVWHEAADTRVFKPVVAAADGDLVWIGNWGDDERAAELREFIMGPVKQLGLRARVHGVRYPESAIHELSAHGIDYGGWVANYDVPEVFARFRVTVHVPRRPYVQMLPGIPTIRPFEALACGVPLVSAPWDDTEGLFRAGQDYLVARSGTEMTKRLRDVLRDAQLSASLAANGLETIQTRHTCAHRVNELMDILAPSVRQTLQSPESMPSASESARRCVP